MIYKQSIKISLDEIQKWSAKSSFSLSVLTLLPFLYMWGYSDSITILGNIHESFFQWLVTFLAVILLFILSITIGGILHELIHAVFFAPFLPTKFKGLKFGYMKDKMALYVHLKEPISITGFRLGTVMPGIVLGIIPIISGIMYGYLSVLLFGLFLTIAAVGDFLLLSKTLHVKSGYKIKDNPDDIGVDIIK